MESGALQLNEFRTTVADGNVVLPPEARDGIVIMPLADDVCWNTAGAAGGACDG